MEKGLSDVANLTTPYSKDMRLIPWIKTIDSNGLMEIRFNKPVIPVIDLLLIKTSDFNVRFEQNSFEKDQTADFKWNVTYFDPFRLFVQLYFSVPIDISQGSIKDMAYVCMQKEIFMIEDKWGLYRYWQGYNDTLNTTDEAANQTTTVTEEVVEEEFSKYKKKSEEDEEESYT